MNSYLVPSYRWVTLLVKTDTPVRTCGQVCGLFPLLLGIFQRWDLTEEPDCFPKSLHTPQSYVTRTLISSHPLQGLSILIGAILVGTSWCLIALLIFISCIASDNEHLFVCWLAILGNTQILCSFLNWVICGLVENNLLLIVENVTLSWMWLHLQGFQVKVTPVELLCLSKVFHSGVCTGSETYFLP
jgi:hypothetical protein